MKVVPVSDLQAWIMANQRDEGGVPVITCPVGQHLENGVCVPDVIIPPTTWLPLNQPNGGFFGYNYAATTPSSVPDFQATGGKTYTFLIDPVSVGKAKVSFVGVADRGQRYPSTLVLSVLDDNNNKVGSPIPWDGGNASYTARFKGINMIGKRLLLEVTPSSTMQMLIYWS
jgi:hypothetical protein